MQVPPLHASVNAAVARLVGPANVEFDGVAKSTWKSNSASVLALAPSASTWFGAPAGGAVAPSRSDPSSPPMVFAVVNETDRAGLPASMLARSRAETSPPRNVVPAALNWLTVR